MPDQLRSNEQIDKINEFNKAHDIETIPYEMTDADNEKLLAENKQKEIDAENERLRIEAENKTAEGTNEGQEGKEVKKEITATKPELSKEDEEAIVKKYLGINSLDEVIKKSDIKKEPTQEEIDAELEKREGNKIAYALQQGKFSDKELKSYIADSNNPDLVFQQYLQEQKAADQNLTDEEIRAEFEEKFGLDQEEDSRKYKRGQTELNLLKDTIIRNRHGKIIKFDDEYTSIEKEQLTQKQLADKVISEAPKYKQVVEEVYSSLKKIPVSFGKGEEYEIDVPDEVINSFKERELNGEFAAKQIKEGYTKENKAEAAKVSIMYENFASFAKQLADKINHKRQAGSKGIPPMEGADSNKVQKKLSPEQEKQLKEFKEVHGAPVAN